MFVEAIKKTYGWTRYVLISCRQADGTCQTSIGAFVVINSDGWAVTAAHIIDQAEKLGRETRVFQGAQQQRAAIQADPSLSKKEHQRQLNRVSGSTRTSVTHSSEYWSWNGTHRTTGKLLNPVDLAFVKLDGIPPGAVTSYPIFKNPTPELPQGRSLCRIGYPFHTITPTFDQATNSFHLPDGSIPPPLFPNEGIFTRVVEVVRPDGSLFHPTIPFCFLETSSAGLRGQSGGPIFDTDGYVWAIQSQTDHHPLGFSPPVPGGRSHEKEHQFMNVGRGIHAKTLVAAMKDLGIAFQVSP